MKNGLAIWHYPHRSMEENISFFAAQGFESLSLLGREFVKELDSVALPEVLRQADIVLTVHFALPKTHASEHTEPFYDQIRRIGRWQEEHGLISVLSFDVYQSTRDNIRPYVDFVLENVPNCRIAVEDFGLTDGERSQLEHLKDCRRFGYLIDIGHMFIRLRGENTGGKTLLSNHPDECPPCAAPGLEAFRTAFRSKTFPVFEIHLHNNDGVRDLHQFLENGELDVSVIAQLLRETGYEGILTIESAPGYQFPCAGQEADDGILRSFRWWQSLCS